MSHFTVMVIGNNPEDQLAPYDESIEMPPYDSGEVSDDDKQRFIQYYTSKQNIPYDGDFDKWYNEHGKSWNNNSWRKHTDGTWHEYSTYNPNSKWDWYQLGGRWCGFLKLKNKSSKVAATIGEPGVGDNEPIYDADIALKKDIDFEYMRNESAEKAAKDYDEVMEIFKGLPENKTWDEIRALYDNIDKAREEYWKQPRCAAWKNANKWDFYDSPDDYLISREQYIQNARNRAAVTFALVKDGVWYEKGEMGWFGMSSNEMTQEEWNEKFNAFLDSIPDDTVISIFDCHI